MSTILVTGGTGYIGSHTCVELLSAGHRLTILDNLSNSRSTVVDQITHITGDRPGFIAGDIRNPEMLDQILTATRYDAVLHFAGLKAVGESVTNPLSYYDNNITGTLTLLQAMQRHGVRKLVFSSSATVYGDPAHLPIQEHFPLHATNPYGRTKLMIEEILGDLVTADPTWGIAILRYFNPVGAHESGLIGEAPNGIPNNLMPYIAQVAMGLRDHLNIFGNDYPTPDGTGIRDYIHVVDLANGHLKALDKLMTHPGLDVYNLGTGKGFSVLEMIAGFEKASGKAIPYRFVPRRPGDVAASFADPGKAEQDLAWSAERGIDAMCRDTWHWVRQHYQADPDALQDGSV